MEVERGLILDNHANNFSLHFLNFMVHSNRLSLPLHPKLKAFFDSLGLSPNSIIPSLCFQINYNTNSQQSRNTICCLLQLLLLAFLSFNYFPPTRINGNRETQKFNFGLPIYLYSTLHYSAINELIKSKAKRAQM